MQEPRNSTNKVLLQKSIKNEFQNSVKLRDPLLHATSSLQTAGNGRSFY